MSARQGLTDRMARRRGLGIKMSRIWGQEALLRTLLARGFERFYQGFGVKMIWGQPLILEGVAIRKNYQYLLPIVVPKRILSPNTPERIST